MSHDPAFRANIPVAGVEIGPVSTGAATIVKQALDRLEEIVDHETDALRHNRALDFAKVNETKSRMLLQLTRAARAMPQGIHDETLGRHALRVRRKLEINRDLLQIHLAAEQEIGNILAGILRDADSDGTYSAVGRRTQDR